MKIIIYPCHVFFRTQWIKFAPNKYMWMHRTQTPTCHYIYCLVLFIKSQQICHNKNGKVFKFTFHVCAIVIICTKYQCSNNSQEKKTLLLSEICPRSFFLSAKSDERRPLRIPLYMWINTIDIPFQFGHTTYDGQIMPISLKFSAIKIMFAKSLHMGKCIDYWIGYTYWRK